MNNQNNVTPIPTGVPPKKQRVTADGEAARYLAIQMENKQRSRGADILLILLTLGFIYVMAILFWVLPDADFSPAENRSLKTAPVVSAETFFSGQLTAEVSDYMADQFPFRGFFVGLKALSETVQFKGENNDVIFGSSGYLIARNDYPNEAFLTSNLEAAARFSAVAQERGIDCVAAFAGRKMDTLDLYLPKLYGSYYGDRIWSRLDTIATENDLPYLDLRQELRTRASAGEPVYYKTDHHWTSLGAYYAYADVMEAFGEAALPLSAFTEEIASEDFYGTTWSSAGVKWAQPDTITYYHGDPDATYRMEIQMPRAEFEERFANHAGCTFEEIDGKGYAVFSDIYVREFLDEKDQYASFIGGNFGYTHITRTDAGERETLLLVKDSFSHSMVQFLCEHYDLILVDLRYYKASMMKLCEEAGVRKVLMLYNMETLTEGNDLSVLKAGLGK